MTINGPHRAAIDHVIELVARSSLSDQLVLCGSMAMLAWFGDRARVPDSLDWIVRPAMIPIHELSPYPHLNQLDAVQTWPELAHGAGRYKMWKLEDFETCGARPRLPPEGLHWMATTEMATGSWPHGDLLDIVQERSETPDRVFLDADETTVYSTTGWCHTSDSTVLWYDDTSRWESYNPDVSRCPRCSTYLEDDYDDDAVDRDASDKDRAYDRYIDSGAARILLPWSTDDTSGKLKINIDYDEALMEPAALAAVPRGDGRPPTAVWAITARQSLMWKLQRLALDQTNRGVSEGSDLYDAVLLAESPEMSLPRQHRDRLRSLLPSPTARNPLMSWRIDWLSVDKARRPHRHYGTLEWLNRLSCALEPMMRVR